MSERIKLQNSGDNCTMTITGVKAESIQNTDYWLFSDATRELVMPQSSMASRLESLGVKTAHDLIGSTIRFSRSTKLSKYGKPFWDCEYASPSEVSPKASVRLPSPVPGEAPSTAAAPRIIGGASGQTYKDTPSWGEWVQQVSTAWAAATDIQGEAGTPESVQAMTATMLIGAQQRGITIPTAPTKRLPSPDADDLDSRMPF